MKNSVKNIILVCAMSSVAIMGVGIFLYDYIPSGLTVSKANQYETSSSTTEVLSEAQEAQGLLTSQSTSTKSSSGSSPVVKTNIVLKEYDVSQSDLSLYQASGSYVKGKADPFAEVQTQTQTSTNTSGENQAGTTTTPNASSDGTFYNSSKVK